MHRFTFLQRVLLGACCFVSAAAVAQSPGPTLVDVSQVETRSLPALDLQRLAEEDRTDALLFNPPRFAVPIKADVSVSTGGTWSEADANHDLWRYRVTAAGAVNLNFGFTRFFLPPSATLTIWSVDGKKKIGPFDAKENHEYAQFWTPIINTDDALIELRVAKEERDLVVLVLGQIGHGYRGMDAAMNAKSGSCNMDVNCLNGAGSPWEEWREVARASATYSTGGSTFCSGSLLNTPRNDKDMLFATAAHCSINADNAPSIVVYWNFENSTCRTPGSAASGQAGNGPTNMTQSGGVHLATYLTSDFTIIRLSTPANPAWNLYWAGWDRNSADRACGPAPGDLCAGIHHPNTDEKRITFVEQDYVPRSYNNPTPPGDGSHWWARWDPTPIFPPNPTQTIPPQVTEPGSSGSPLYTKERRYVGQLHGGPSACGATGINLSDYYGRLSVSWEGGGAAGNRAKDHLDPDNTQAMTVDGRGECTAPPVPVSGTATATAPNQITVSWTASAGAERYRVYRAAGSCATAVGYTQIGESTTTSYVDNTVSGAQTYSYKVTAFDDAETCESAQSTCSQATATGQCTTPPTFAGLQSATSAGTNSCGVNLAWNAATVSCGTAPADVRYNVYRSTTAGFTPSASNRLVTCATAPNHTDTTVASGTPYYYIVRAEDTEAVGTGVCGGNEETNTVERVGAAFGPDAVTFTDNLESGTANFAVSGTGAGANFAAVTNQSHSPSTSYFAPDPNAISDRQLALANPIVLAAGSNATLSFWHRRDLETNAGATTGYDGGVLEYSIDGGTTWVDIKAASGAVPANAGRILTGDYNFVIPTNFQSPIGGRSAWGGQSLTWTEVRVSLADFGGQSLRLRWRLASDESVADVGWWIDDISISEATECGATLPDAMFQDGFETP